MYINQEKLEQYLKDIVTWPEKVEEYAGMIQAMATSGVAEKLFFSWCAEDIAEINPFYTEEEAISVLKAIELGYEGAYTHGVHWDIIKEGLEEYGYPKKYLEALRTLVHNKSGLMYTDQEITEILDQDEVIEKGHIDASDTVFTDLVWRYFKDELIEGEPELLTKNLLDIFKLSPIDIIKNQI